jgi:hypothetical protein
MPCFVLGHVEQDDVAWSVVSLAALWGKVMLVPHRVLPDLFRSSLRLLWFSFLCHTATPLISVSVSTIRSAGCRGCSYALGLGVVRQLSPSLSGAPATFGASVSLKPVISVSG